MEQALGKRRDTRDYGGGHFPRSKRLAQVLSLTSSLPGHCPLPPPPARWRKQEEFPDDDDIDWGTIKPKPGQTPDWDKILPKGVGKEAPELPPTPPALSNLDPRVMCIKSISQNSREWGVLSV